ncbi:MAG: hypothetical protein JNL83_03850, partial [Myxococcales bacterium]|nr:hypothetical protein [Myxococcales bacterium]
YETYQAVIDCAVDPPSKINHELDPALDAVVMKALAKDKEDRYQTAEAFGDALLSYLHHRGKGSGPGDVSRFFDGAFAQEIEEHGARMRELISGRDFSVDTGVNWDGEEEEKKRGATVDMGGRKGPDTQSISLSAADMIPDRPSQGALSDVIGGLGDSTGDDDEIPADKTRIETNPLEQINELERERELERQRERVTPLPPKLMAARQQAVPAHAASPQTSPTVALKADRAQSVSGGTPKPTVMPPSGPLPLPAPPTGPVAGVRPPTGSGFPNFSNLPTMIADPEPEPDGAQAKTALGGPLVDPRTGAPHDPPHTTSPTMPPPQQQRPTMPPQSSLAGYPVMSAEMSEQIARGADLFPSRPPGAGPQPAPHLPQPQPQPQLPAHAPHSPHASPPTLQPQDAAHLMSPVGHQYAQHVNWADAAAMPARALPKWKLALVFVGAITAALIITIIIAKLAT